MKIILESENNSAKIAADFLRDGKVIAIATDTVYGLAVDAQNKEAVEKLYQIKKRDKNKPIAIFLPDSLIAKKLFVINNIARKIIDKFFPGQVTLVLESLKKPEIHLAPNLNENDDFLGFRVVKTKLIEELFKNFSGILAVTSANISGANAIISAEEIKNNNFLSKIDLLVDSGLCKDKKPSTVIKIIDDKIILLREGQVEYEQIKNSIL